MIISDLNHLETIFEDTAITGGTGVQVIAEGTAYGDSSSVIATATTSIRELPYDGFIGNGQGFVLATASDPIDPTATASVFGAAEGTKTIIKTQIHSVDHGSSVMTIGHITVKAITPPSPN